MMRRLAMRRLLVAGALAAALDVPAAAAAWPPPRLRLLVAYPVGGLSSDVARALAEVLMRQLGVPVTVEHRPGAGGTLAIDAVARAAGDGSLLVFSAITPLTLAPLLGPVPYDPRADVQPVIGVMATPVLVVGTSALAAGDWPAMLALARQRPGALRWATSGIGTTGHLVLERAAAAAGVEVTHVPYKGGGQQITDALGGQFELLSTNLAPVPLRHVREGRLRALAVTGARRHPALPEVPTLAEQGLASANLVSTFALFAAGATPPAAVRQINGALQAALDDAALRRLLKQADNEVLGGSAEALAQRIDAEREMHRAWLARPR